MSRLQIYTKNLFLIFGFLLFSFLLFALLNFISYYLTSSFLEGNNVVSKLNDPRISNKLKKQIQSEVKEFNSISSIDFLQETNENITVDFGLQGFIDCYKASNSKPNSILFSISVIEKIPPKINWSTVQADRSGYYQGKDCFAVYINPDKGLSSANLKESAVFSEALIRKVAGKYIEKRKEFRPSENVELVAFSSHNSLERYGDNYRSSSIFGIWDRYDQKIYLNSESPSTNLDIGWRLIHEMNHSLSNDSFALTPSSYGVPEEAFTEFAGNYIAKHSGKNFTGYSPAISELLKYISEEELIRFLL